MLTILTKKKECDSSKMENMEFLRSWIYTFKSW